MEVKEPYYSGCMEVKEPYYSGCIQYIYSKYSGYGGKSDLLRGAVARQVVGWASGTPLTVKGT